MNGYRSLVGGTNVSLIVKSGLGEKRINNILVVLSKALRYALDCELIAKVPKIGLFEVERPAIVAWEFEPYGSLLAAAKAGGARTST